MTKLIRLILGTTNRRTIRTNSLRYGKHAIQRRPNLRVNRMHFRLQTIQRRQTTSMTSPRVYQRTTSMLTRLRRALFSLRHNLLPRRLVRPTRLFNRTRRTTLQNRTFPSLVIRPLYGTIRPNLQFRPRNRLGKHGTIMRNVQRPRHHTNINNVTMRGVILFRVPLHYLTNRPRRDTRKLRTLLLHRVRGTLSIRPRPLGVKHTFISLRRILLRIINRLTL